MVEMRYDQAPSRNNPRIVASGSNEPVRVESQIAQAMDEQDKEIMELHAALRALEERLQNVLMPDDPKDAVSILTSPVVVPLVASIRGRTLSINQAVGMVSNIIERLGL